MSNEEKNEFKDKNYENLLNRRKLYKSNLLKDINDLIQYCQEYEDSIANTLYVVRAFNYKNIKIAYLLRKFVPKTSDQKLESTIHELLCIKSSYHMYISIMNLNFFFFYMNYLLTNHTTRLSMYTCLSCFFIYFSAINIVIDHRFNKIMIPMVKPHLNYIKENIESINEFDVKNPLQSNLSDTNDTKYSNIYTADKDLNNDIIETTLSASSDAHDSEYTKENTIDFFISILYEPTDLKGENSMYFLNDENQENKQIDDNKQIPILDIINNISSSESISSSSIPIFSRRKDKDITVMFNTLI